MATTNNEQDQDHNDDEKVSDTTSTNEDHGRVASTTALPTATAISTSNHNNNLSDQDFMDAIIQSYLPNNSSNHGKNKIPNSHIRIGLTNLLHAFQKDMRTLLYHQQVPKHGWSDYSIQYFLQTLSSLDTNIKVPISQQQQQQPHESQRWVGVGEREGKVYSSLVLQRHFGYTHGMGRSGNLFDPQPKAVGSTILTQLTNQLLYDIIVRGGSHINPCTTTGSNNAKQKQPQQHPRSIILPSCTGMSIALVLQTLRHKHLQSQRRRLKLQPTVVLPNKDIVLWSRIDQKSCYKAIVAAGLQCIVIPTRIDQDAVVTDIAALERAIQTYTPARILAVITTTSCFAPRVPDQVDVVAKLIQQYNNNINNNCHMQEGLNEHGIDDDDDDADKHMYHVINHAYGLQCSKTGKLLTRAMTIGQVDAIVCSLDKNFLVPVSGSVVLSPHSLTIQQIGKIYAGRASASHIIDICATLLSMGLTGYQQLHQQRQNVRLPQFVAQFQTMATKYNERLLVCPTNTISFAMTLDHLVRPHRSVSNVVDGDDDNDHAPCLPDPSETEEEYLKSIERDLTQLGAMLFHRCISGTRVVARNIQQTLGDEDVFDGFGSSTNHYPHAYITAACAFGLNEMEVNEFFLRLDKTIQEFQKKQRKKK